MKTSKVILIEIVVILLFGVLAITVQDGWMDNKWVKLFTDTSADIFPMVDKFKTNSDANLVLSFLYAVISVISIFFFIIYFFFVDFSEWMFPSGRVVQESEVINSAEKSFLAFILFSFLYLLIISLVGSDSMSSGKLGRQFFSKTGAAFIGITMLGIYIPKYTVFYYKTYKTLKSQKG